MNPNQQFSTFLENAVNNGLKSSDVVNERGRIFREIITPALVKRGANDTDMANAQAQWNQATDREMQAYSFLPKNGQSMRSAEKDLRAERAVNEAARTGSKLPVIKETLLSTGETIANAFGTGANQMVSSAARFVNDIGENEKNTVSDRIANFADSNAKAFGKAASSGQVDMQAGKSGKAAQLGIGAVQSVPAMALPFGVAGGVAKGASMALGAGKAAATIGATAGLVAGHTQNYGEVRRGSIDNLQRDFPTAESLQGNPVYEQKFAENYNSGMSMDAAKQQAYTQTLDHLSEHAADVYGTAMTALDVIAPDGALLGSGLMKYLPNSKLTRFMGGGTDTHLVQQQFNQVPRTGLASLMPDTSWAANKAGLGILGREGLQEGSQGAVGEYGAQAASADIGGRPVDWKKVGQSFVDEAIVGGIMGAGMRLGSGHTPNNQAQHIAQQIRTQTSSVIQDEAKARQSLSEAMQQGHATTIQEAQADLDLVQQRATALQDVYAQYDIAVPNVIERMAVPAAQQQTSPATPPTTVPPVDASEREEWQRANATRLANQQQFEQVYGKGTPDPVIDIATLNPAIIDHSKLPEIETPQTEVKPSISNIVNRHVENALLQEQQQAESHPPELTDFEMENRSNGQQDWSSDAIFDDLLNAVPVQNSATPEQVSNAPLSSTAEAIRNGMNEISKGMDEGARDQVAQYLKEGKTERLTYRKEDAIQAAVNNPNYNIQHNQDGSVTVIGVKTADDVWHGIQAQGAETHAETALTENKDTQSGISETFTGRSENIDPASTNPNETTQETSSTASFTDRLIDAHLNDPNSKTKIINDEIATGRPRHEVLAEVSKIIDQIKSHKKDDDSDDSDGSIGEPTSPKPNTPPVPENKIDENTNENGEQPYDGMDYGDIGRKSDGLPFANQGAAKNYQKKYSLENTHDIIQVGKGTKFVLRPKSQTPLKDQIAESGKFQKYHDIARQYGRSVTSSGVILTPQGKDTGVRIVEKNRRMRVESKDDQLLFSAASPQGLESFFKSYWGDVKLDEGQLAQDQSAEEIRKDIAPQPKPAPKTIGQGENARTFIGKNQQDQAVYEDAKGTRSILNDGVLKSEKGSERQDTFKTVDELNEKPTEKPAETANNQQVNKENTNERLTDGTNDQEGAQTVSGRGSATQQPAQPANTGDVETEQSRDGSETEQVAHPERSGVRSSRKNVENQQTVPESGDASDGRTGTGREGTPDAGRGSPTTRPNVKSDSAVKVTAHDFHLDNPLDIVGGTPVQRFDKNRKALELLDELETEGRQATPEEQAVLAGYIGFGSFGQDLFQGTWDKPVYRDQKSWEERSKWLRERLGEQAWKSAQRSITNAHYTDPHTVTTMWAMLRRMGVIEGRMLEPAMGTGNFFSMMPMDIKQRSQLTGIELDITTGAIAKQLFPNSNIQIMGYQESKTPDNFYDVVVSNFPFENTPIADRKYNKFNPMLHDYFFLKAIDQVRAGGLVMSITSAGTMDKQGQSIRRELAKSAELVAAIRLPSGAFKEYAGTDVVTDIIILRKRPEKLAIVPENTGWINTQEVDTPSGTPVKVNEYYAHHPQNILGTLDYGHGTTTFKAGMVVHRPENMLERLKDAIDLVPENALQPKNTTEHLTYFANKTGERHGSLNLVNGELMIAVGDQLVQAKEHTKYALKDSKKTAQREQGLKDVVELRKLYTALVDSERSGNEATTERKTLNKAYQDYIKAHGPLRDSFALGYLERIDDPFYASIAALENDDGTPATILKKSTTRGKSDLANPTVSDAYIIARNQSISPNVEQIAKIANKPVADVRKELVDKGAVFELPNGDIAPTDLYLSGNVREKLREARAAVDAGHTAMQKNVDALKEVIPADVPYFNIETKMGAAWVPDEQYQNYIAHMLNLDSTEGIQVNFKTGRWSVKLDKHLKYLTEAHSNFGSPHIGFDRLVQAALSNQTLRLNSNDEKGNKYYDAQKSEEANASLAKIRDEFSNWLWSDAERKVQLEREYNEAMNAWATPKYDGSFMSMEGMALQIGNNPFNLRQHQLNAIWRAVANRRSMNAHEVGTGKTFTMGGIAVESRRYGIAKKPLLLAHNANSASVAAEIRMMYPNARVLYLSELSPKVRALRLRQIANDDWDVVVMPHSMIDRLTLNEDTLMAMAADDIAALEEEFYAAADEEGISTDKVNLDDEDTFKHIRSVTAKELAKARKTIIENIRKQAQLSSREDAVSFEELGVDMVLVDEVQEFKKPPIVTRMRMKGLNTQTSQRSIALQFLTRYVRRMNNGGNVHTFTGTYITNTITEIYHQMRYVMEEEMNKANVSDWDGWFGSFASELQDVELTAAGEYEMVTRLAGFVNVPELRRMVGQFMDTVFAEDMPEMKPRKTKSGKVLTDASLTEAERVELLNGRTENAMDRPYKKVINESAEMTASQKQLFDHLQQLSREWRTAEPKQRRDWMNQGDEHSPIIVEGKANKASLDVRLNDESLAGMEGQTNDDPNSKASRVVKNVAEIYTSHPHANQVIFTDNGFNTSVQRTARSADGDKSKYTVKVFSTVNDIVARLVQQGIPRNQIAVVTGTTSKEKRREIANAMNNSMVRVVIGSTDTLGVGVNMQRNLRAMHHLDAPYMPGDLEQRNGRGLRQANQWNTVLEYRYMTDRLDGRRWQILAVKQRFINAFMKANSNVRVIEGEAAADEQSDILESFSEAAGDPRVLQRVKLRKKLDSLHRKERLYTKGIADMQGNIRSEQRYYDELNEEITQIRDSKLLENLRDLLQSQQDHFTMQVQGKTYTSRKDAQDAISQYIDDHVRFGTEQHVFAQYAGHPVSIQWTSMAENPVTTIRAFGHDYDGAGIRGAEAKMRNVPKNFNTKVDALHRTQQTIENLKNAASQPFGQQKDLKQVEKQLSDLELDLEINPVPPPAWLRQGAPIDSEVFYKDKSYVVLGHRYASDNYYVIAEDAKGMTLIPYTDVVDQSGMPVYEPHDFIEPEVMTKKKDNQETKTDQPLYSRRDNLEFVHDAMAELAEHDELFRYPVSQKKTLQSIFKDVMGDQVQYIGEVTATDERQESTADHKYLYRIKGKDFYVYERDNGEIWVDVSRLNEGDQGSGIFAAFGNYAHNTDKVIIRDPEGLSEAAVVRATSAMLSLALRFGTTRFFEPATEQLKGNSEKGIAPLKWYTNDIDNIRSLIDTFVQTTHNQFKGLDGYHYDFRAKQFRDRHGRSIEPSRFQSLNSRTSSSVTSARAGSATTRRAIFLQSLASSESSQRPQLLEQFIRGGKSLVQSPELKGIFSKNEGISKTGHTPDQVRKTLVDRFGESTIAKLEQQGILEIVDTTPSHISETGIEGYYRNGKVSLIADNLTADTIIPTFLHELGGHAGFQSVMKPETYQNLMDSFNRMVESGNPIAMEAKRRAEVEKDTKTQQLEYLPYLLTVASEGKFGNSTQKRAISRLITRIVSAIKAFLFDKFDVKLNLTPDDMVVLAERMINQVADQGVHHEMNNQTLFSRADINHPESQPRSRQKEILDAVGKSALGQMALLNAERAKTISKRTGSLFSTMLHKALQNNEFKKTFDLVQNKINHVTYASSASMDVAPGILTQLETWKDYKTEARNVGQKVAHTFTAGKVARPQNEIDLEKVGELLFSNTLSDDPKVYKVSELHDLGFTESQIDLYRQARKAVETSLDEFAKTTVSNIFKHFGGSTKEILELTAKNLKYVDHALAIKTRMNRIALDEPDKAEAAAVAEKHIDEVLDKLAKLKNEGYMPLMRFGKYYFRVIDPATKTVAHRQHFESEAERNMAVRNYEVPDGYTIESSQINDLEHTLFEGVSPETLALFAKESGIAMDNMQEAFIKHAVRDNHALKRLLRRKGIQGFNEDTKRVLAAFVLSNARYAANQLFNPAIDESIVEIKDPAYAEDAIRLRDYALDPKEEVSGIKNFSFVWYMGASFMFGVVNLTQPFLQTLPYLLQYSKDWSVTGKAVLQASKSWYGKDIPAKYKVAYERARKEGHLDPQNTWMLQGLERGKSGLGASTWQLISHASGFFAQASETVNRRAALFASLDVAEQMGQAKLEKFGFKDAYDFAVRTIQETQGIYNKGNRPRAARGNVGSLLMMYKQFMIAYVEQMVRMQRAGLYGGEDDEFKRKMAKLVGFGISRSLLVALGVLWSFAGATGLPFVRDLLDAVETAGGMVGKPFNTEREVQIALHTALGDTLGESATTLLLDGAINLNPVVDVKGRMGMGDLIPGTAYFSPLTSEYQKSKELSGLGGAIGGLLQKVGDAMDFAKIGDYSQATMQLAPKAVTSLGQGAVAATTGDYRNMQTGVKTNDASVLDGIVKALDAQPAQIAKEGRVRGLEMKDKAAVQYNNKRTKEEYEEALATGDINEVNKVKQKIKDHNADNPRYPITLNLKTTETNFKKSNMSWQEKRKDAKGLAWMNTYNPYIEN